jgi:helicase
MLQRIIVLQGDDLDITELSRFGISQTLIDRLSELGYHRLTTVQEQAVEGGLFEKKNMVVIAPTNTGKTFVGELAALAASTRKEAPHTFFLVPLKALAEEKFQDFVLKYSKWGLKVAISTSERTEFDDDLLSYQVIIATYEKMNALLVRNPDIIGEVGVVIVDELQNISSDNRGVTLEILLTTLVTSSKRPQIIALSATVSNKKEVAEWLDAVLIQTDKRDVDLREGIIYTGQGTLRFEGHELTAGDFIYKEFNTGKKDVEKALGYHTFEGLTKASETEQTLIFVDTQGGSERLAERLAGALPPASNIADIIELLDSAVESTPSTRRLKEVLQNGVAFHHAGLLPEERAIVEDVFERGLAKVICATTTLGAGVNTPARNVIILNYQSYDKRSIKTRDYKNMAGRAGRIRSADNFGRSVLLAENEREMQMLWKEYVTATPESLRSQIGKSERLDVSILGLISSLVCVDIDDLLTFMKATFFGYTYYLTTSDVLKKAFEDSIVKRIKSLEEAGFLSDEEGKVTVTELGKRVAEEMLSPSTAELFYKTLKDFGSKQSKDLIKLVEPLIHLACCSPDAQANDALLFYPRFEPEIKELGDYWEYNKNTFLTSPVDRTLLVKSLRTTRMLMRWIEGVPYSELSSYGKHGIVKRKAETVSWLIRGLSRIAEKPIFNFDYSFVRFLRILSERLYYGVPESALPIMRLKIPQVHRHRAIALVEAGFATVDQIITANADDLTKARGITEKLALEIKKHVERHIDDANLAAYHRQRRMAQLLGKNAGIIDQLYEAKGDNFARVFDEIFRKYMWLKSAFVGDASQHEVDVIIETSDGKIAVEGKRFDQRNVSAREAEEVIGKGSKHKPIASVTIGYPDFADEAKRNSSRAKVTLIRASVLGDMLIAHWEGKVSQKQILKILKSERHVEDPYQETTELKLA